MSLLLQAEIEYHNAVKNSVKSAEKYVDDSRKEQTAYIEELKQSLLFYEKTESEMLEQTLFIESEKMEITASGLKEQMKIRKEDKADQISELLKEEVLSLLWR